MGTDIHGFWEVCTPDGSWVAFRDIGYVGRNYRWFGLAAGVRMAYWPEEAEGGEPWDRGVPSDASSAWKLYVEHYGITMHSKTWLTLGEVGYINKLDNDLEEDSYSELDVSESSQDGFLLLPCEDDSVTELIVSWDTCLKQEVLPVSKTLWELRDPSKPFNECIRLMIGFDS